jgi:hypothetical protein
VSWDIPGFHRDGRSGIMPLDPLCWLSDPTCHGLTLSDEACVKLTCCKGFQKLGLRTETWRGENAKARSGEEAGFGGQS